ncbi:2-phospho-L-lactate guanylyltransferase [Kitasatospora sp. GP82]|uniref:2-phospho-L-lactate guanylyltransferase n=1 Tax=Kitasatospora sp. GP82 TaxID=3035089 RepID=UPI002473B2FA|nr:2-phospho-L-lactate guanylyltransferase [Kitasatospora sp. GP82]MDH6129659.1 2-phospho-L-lactate guanylyltransferase [Kitasatospora sp. GP82]
MTQDTVRPVEPVPPAARPGWSLVLPVKSLALAKSRLGAFAGERRPALALAFALDTVTAALACRSVARVLVVTQDRAAGPELARIGALVLDDEPGGGLNPALAHGAAHARRIAPHSPVAALSADLPALRPAELARVLAAVPRTGRAFLADAPGLGTTLLACAPGSPLQPEFGGASRARHAAGGAYEITLPDVPSVRRDVDTGRDLAAALALGLGPHTAAAATPLFQSARG